MEMVKFISLVENGLSALKQTESYGNDKLKMRNEEIKISFKIDGIVWKFLCFLPCRFFIHCFKIDGIVWKYKKKDS